LDTTLEDIIDTTNCTCVAFTGRHKQYGEVIVKMGLVFSDAGDQLMNEASILKHYLQGKQWAIQLVGFSMDFYPELKFLPTIIQITTVCTFVRMLVLSAGLVMSNTACTRQPKGQLFPTYMDTLRCTTSPSQYRSLLTFFGLELMAALEDLHSGGILHCDLKPENIIVTQMGTPLLIDFGLAREMTSEGVANYGSLWFLPDDAWRRGHTASSDMDGLLFTILLHDIGRGAYEVLIDKLGRMPSAAEMCSVSSVIRVMMLVRPDPPMAFSSFCSDMAASTTWSTPQDLLRKIKPSFNVARLRSLTDERRMKALQPCAQLTANQKMQQPVPMT